ncbi:GntR family transcriptional regulator [Streptomyces sp. NPDC007991]|uniref:GntR family transcriptional regulator n=1 Tax=Streptomyces sp. NPDC007991 TaxID=3364803 RepID=UPI0036E37022
MSSRTGYAEIATYFRQQIADGTLAPGDRLPSQREVQEQFGASITTVNRAFQILKADGLTVSTVGQGTKVADRPNVAATGAARLRRISRTGLPYGPKEKSIKHTAAMRSCADPDIAASLGVDLHDEIVLRTRVFTRRDVPTIAAFSCIHPRALDAVPELMSGEPMGRFWQEIYTERTDRVVTKLPERRGARFASTNELELLQVDAPPQAAVPVLVLVNVFHDEDGPLEYWEDIYAPGLWQVDEE